jgi:hypothetical protein
MAGSAVGDGKGDNAGHAGGSKHGGVSGAGSGGGGSTLSAMEQYMRRLEERDKAAARDADSDEERRRRAEPLLKETAFDRRKVVAVFKHDGSRGHHMSDYVSRWLGVSTAW